MPSERITVRDSGDAIRIITTGGTIDKVYFDARSDFQVGEPVIGAVLREALVGFEYQVEALMQKDSLDMNDADRERIRAAVEAAPEHRILVTHGTDTMTHTAEVLAGVQDKTVVLTGALTPARFRASDAIFNIGAATAALQLLPPGIYIAMNGRIFTAGKVRKNLDSNRFESLEAKD
jgi:L-asparaginase